MVDAISTALSALQTASQKVDKAAKNIADPEKFQETGGVQDIIDIKVATIEYKANLAMIETVEDLKEDLLRIFDEEI
jgi:flagellar basal body rod protein FlgC